MHDQRTRACKVCGEVVRPLHEVAGEVFYYCRGCDFLQNFYWDDHPVSEQHAVNATVRDEKWRPGPPDVSRAKGWECVSYMTSPVAWRSRQIHAALMRAPVYRQLHEAHIRKTAHRILDFGCGHGEIVDSLRREGFDCIGLDPFSPRRAPHILRVPLVDAPLAAESLDGIFAIETMEHISHVLDTYRALARLLRPGGVLLVQTHRLEDPDYLSDRERWFYLEDPKTHVSIYSRRAMERIAERTGFQDVRFRGIKFAKFVK